MTLRTVRLTGLALIAVCAGNAMGNVILHANMPNVLRALALHVGLLCMLAGQQFSVTQRNP